MLKQATWHAVEQLQLGVFVPAGKAFADLPSLGGQWRKWPLELCSRRGNRYAFRLSVTA